MPKDDRNQLTSVVLKWEEDYCNEVDHAYPRLKLLRLQVTCKGNTKIALVKMQTLMIVNGEFSVLQQMLESLILEFLILATLICFGWLSAGKWQRTEDCFQESEATGETTEPWRQREERNIPVEVWTPTAELPGRLVLLSHALRSSAFFQSPSMQKQKWISH